VIKIELKRFVWIAILWVTQVFVSIAQTDYPEESDILNQSDGNPPQRWVRQLRNIIIASPENEPELAPPNIYFAYEGRTISAIRVVRLKPFGTSITEASRDITLLGRAGNAIHVSTAEFVIRNALMFREGDVVSGLRLAYSERYLRSLGYVGDARIIASSITDDEVEIVVVVQDVLPYSVAFDTNLETRANFSLANKNIIGLGVELRGGVFIDSQKDHLMGYTATLHAQNIGRSLISFQADYLDRFENQLYGFALRRDFYLPATRYAGHLIFYDVRTPVRYFDHSGMYPSITPISIRYNQWEAWLGRAFQVGNRQNRNITLSLGAQSLYFNDRPERSEEFYYRFQNRTTYLASLTLSQNEFYRTALIYNYGRTEDIPYGYKFSITGGVEDNEMYTRPYIGANFSSGYFIPRLGHLSGSLSYGTFFNRGIDQGIIDLELKGFSNLYAINNFRHRTFINAQYTRQLFNRLDDKLIIDGEHGIPGFRNDSVLGRHRFNLSLEQNFFAPWEVYGFRFVFYTFAYLSWLGGYDTPIMLSNLYSSFGLGVRLRNNRLIFNTLQIQFAYFPNIPRNSRFQYIHFSSEKVLRPLDFMPRAPEVLPMY